MSLELLIPLGLLGLLSIAVLILIYIIRPNYQTKHVTSTYIWKLSLGYRRRRPPTNKLRNILIFICQLLILTSMSLILAWPSLVERTAVDENDVIFILDSSASMYTETNGETRFARAVEDIRGRADGVIAEGGSVTLIVADDAPYFLARREDVTHRMRLMADIDELGDRGASYAVSDMEGALGLAQEVLGENPAASVVVFTDTEYAFVPARVDVQLVRDETEWNAAILDASAVREDGYYAVTVQVACYGVSQLLDVTVHVEGANCIPASGVEGENVEFGKVVDCSDDAVKTVVFRVGGGVEDENLFYYDVGDNQRFFSYRSIQIGIQSDDSYTMDNNFFLYGGQKELIRAQYYSTDPNPFTQTALAIARNALSDRYDLEVTEVKQGDAPELSGYDFYVFEHGMPSRLPTDGAILLLDPNPDLGNNSVPADAGFTAEQMRDLSKQSVSLAEGEDYEGHPVTKYLIASDIEVSRYDVLGNCDPAYDILLTYDGNPMLMVRNEKQTKIAVMAFSVHYSNLAKLPENFLLMYSILDYFFPTVVSGNDFEVDESFSLDTRGETLSFSGSDAPFTAEELPRTFSIAVPGSYRFSQTTYYGKDISFEVFIRPPAEESDIRKVADGLSDPYENTEAEVSYRDLLLIMASILVGLLLVEWFLQSRENK